MCRSASRPAVIKGPGSAGSEGFPRLSSRMLGVAGQNMTFLDGVRRQGGNGDGGRNGPVWPGEIGMTCAGISCQSIPRAEKIIRVRGGISGFLPQSQWQRANTSAAWTSQYNKAFSFLGAPYFGIGRATPGERGGWQSRLAVQFSRMRRERMAPGKTLDPCFHLGSL